MHIYTKNERQRHTRIYTNGHWGTVKPWAQRKTHINTDKKTNSYRKRRHNKGYMQTYKKQTEKPLGRYKVMKIWAGLWDIIIEKQCILWRFGAFPLKIFKDVWHFHNYGHKEIFHSWSSQYFCFIDKVTFREKWLPDSQTANY